LGLLLKYTVKESHRARRVLLRLSAREGLVITVPAGFDQRRLPALLEQKQRWIERAWQKLQVAGSPLQPEAEDRFPTSLNLLTIGEEWKVKYYPMTSRSVTAVEKAGHILLLTGKTRDRRACIDALRRWLLRKAHQHLEPGLLKLAREGGFEVKRVLIKLQRTRWGSCSSRKTISLNAKLLFVPPECARYALVHELCHTIQMNHSSRFWALLERHVPHCKATAKELRSGWRYVPSWLNERPRRRRPRPLSRR
jgi:predicted metal-dependent hydrolase